MMNMCPMRNVLIIQGKAFQALAVLVFGYVAEEVITNPVALPTMLMYGAA